MKIYKPAEVKGTTEYTGLVKFIVDDCPSITVGDFVIKEDDALGPEANDTDKVYFVVDGQLSVEEVATGKKNIVNKGEILLIPAGEEHKSTSADGKDAFILWFRSL